MGKRKVHWFIKWLYKKWLRPFLLEQVHNPNVEWDDKLVALVDKLFNYNN